MPATVAGGVIVKGVIKGIASDKRLSTSFSARNSSAFKFMMFRFVATRSLCVGTPSTMVTRSRLASSRRISSKNEAYPES